MKNLLTTLIWLAVMTVWLVGCVNKVYDRTTITIDPNGVMHFEQVHGGITGIATDTEFESFVVVSGSRTVKVVKAKENQDSIKAIVPAVGVVETK